MSALRKNVRCAPGREWKAEDSRLADTVTKSSHICIHFYRSSRPPQPSNSVNMKDHNYMNVNIWTAGLTLAGVAALATGCAERRVEYVPVYRVQPAYIVQPAYPPPAQPPTGTVPAAPTANWQTPVAAPAPVPAPPTQPVAPPPQPVVVTASAPPAALVEVIPVAPGPYYVWTPGYYAWNGGWIWIGGRYVTRPRPTAVWVGGRWTPHGHGYIWIGGGWR